MIIEVGKLPDSVKSIIRQQTTDSEVDVYWSNGCNEEGEDFYELQVESTDNQITYFYKEGWGEINGIEEALEELE
ncbi:hypothetical protein [Paenibacillus sp. XY044]|uniref:hypothetical protein n=1 Tax=Paenibacillus sp. XY044 TaxID=2026089 RepID=UPI000B98F759|nr:hypothetical protein [Paenibacillus sp. XY044]OZB98105.1 hypothetical protein CJP46_02755 [Paenibacillus sp. XY044]